jgi:hypothetical protein
MSAMPYVLLPFIAEIQQFSRIISLLVPSSFVFDLRISPLLDGFGPMENAKELLYINRNQLRSGIGERLHNELNGFFGIRFDLVKNINS